MIKTITKVLIVSFAILAGYCDTIATDRAILRVDNEIYFKSELIKDLEVLSCAQEILGRDKILPLSLDYKKFKGQLDAALDLKTKELTDLFANLIIIYKVMKFYDDKVSEERVVDSEKCPNINKRLLSKLLYVEDFLSKKYFPKEFVLLDTDLQKIKIENPIWSEEQVKRYLEQNLRAQKRQEAQDFLHSLGTRYVHELYIR